MPRSSSVGKMDPCCPNCGETFVRITKGYRRFKISSRFTPATAKALFPSLPRHSVICDICCNEQDTVTVPVGKRSRKRRLAEGVDVAAASLSSPLKKRPSVAQPPAQVATDIPVRRPKYINYLKTSKYKLAFRSLLRENGRRPRAKAAMVSVVAELLKKELWQFSKSEKNSIFSQILSPESLSSFSWKKLLEEAEKTLPTAIQLLRAFFPDEKHFARKGTLQHITETEAREIMDSRLGLILSIVMFTRSCTRNKFVQSCIAVEMWRQQCNEKMFKTFRSLGISQGSAAARSHVETLGGHHADEIKEWKRDVEAYLPKAPHLNGVNETVEVPKGYVVGWDKAQVSVRGRKSNTVHKNELLQWGMCFGVQNRISTLQYVMDHPKKASTMSPYCFLPSQDDYNRLKERMVFVVTRILASNMTCLMDVPTEKHMPHAFSAEMTEQSKVVSLGLVDENPSSTEGVIQIMHHLQEYIPNVNGKFYPTLASGNSSSGERMRMSKQSSVNNVSPEGRMEGLEESPQEFHKEGLLLQDSMDSLLNDQSCDSRGTLSHLKSYFGHKSLRKKVMDNFRQAFDLFRFSTEAYILLLACRLTDIRSLKDVPKDFPITAAKSKKQEWLHRLAQNVVEFCWSPIKMEDVRQVAEAFRAYPETADDAEVFFPYCICETDREEYMVQCCNSTCATQLFHASCLGVATPGEDDDWYCSRECKQSDSYIYCICQRKKPKAVLVQCALKSCCKRYEWYHLPCIGRKTEDLEENWFCSEDCALGAEEDDGILNYSKNVIWEGLNLLVRHDAVREGDGPEIVSHWKLDLVNFWMKNHDKYFASAVHFLAGSSGFHGERIKQDLIWNRVANLHGTPAGNIGLDMVNDVMNKNFKEMLSHSHVRYTPVQIKRVAEASCAYGRMLDRLFPGAGLGKLQNWGDLHSRPGWFAKDLETFVSEFYDDALVDYLPVRKHRGIDFTLPPNRTINNPRQMGLAIGERASAMDFWKDMSHGLQQ